MGGAGKKRVKKALSISAFVVPCRLLINLSLQEEKRDCTCKKTPKLKRAFCRCFLLETPR